MVWKYFTMQICIELMRINCLILPKVRLNRLPVSLTLLTKKPTKIVGLRLYM